MNHTDNLHLLYIKLKDEYYLYQSAAISEKEYLIRARPIDKAIGELEMSTLQDTPVWIEAFSRCTLKQAR